MTAQEIRKKYLNYFETRAHAVIPRASLVPGGDPTTLFTGSGMQPLVPYLLGQPHPAGNRLVNSQTCFRAEDMDEVSDNRHTTFFEMLGNWSLGDYYQSEQLTWFFEFLTDELGLDPQKLYVTCFIGDENSGVPRDTQSASIWNQLFKSKGISAKTIDVGSEQTGYGEDFLKDSTNRIFYYDASKNWWSRMGVPANMAEGEPGGPDSEVFYDFGTPHDEKYGKNCHPNCDCGRFLEIGNSVFMAYKKVNARFEALPKPNVDFGGGLERIAAASINSPDIFEISLLRPVIDGLERLSGRNYDAYQASMRVIADHLRAAVWLAVDGVIPSNKQQGYVLRRLLRRAIRYAFDLGIEQDLCEKVATIVIDTYAPDFPELNGQKNEILKILSQEERIFRQTLRAGVREFEKLMAGPLGTEVLGEAASRLLTGELTFLLYDTYGFPLELSREEAKRRGINEVNSLEEVHVRKMEEQRQRSQTASQGMFKGGLADQSEETVKLHTTTHLMYQALKQVLGSHVMQRGSNITAERTRFDFSHPQKVTSEEMKQVEDIVNQKITEDLPVTWKEENTEEAFNKGASGAFGDRYGNTVKVYTIGDSENSFSREICGGPHVEHTGAIGEGGKKFKIIKEEASSAGVRRIKAVLQ
ncbi:alanine--tRNA ligase [Candidatus Saccharibacteria bacterium]|nr:alanine--tRNA ligase [Candidatus Saccharibacteria bacterium]